MEVLMKRALTSCEVKYFPIGIGGIVYGNSNKRIALTICELNIFLGIGGIAYGSSNEEIALTSCEVVGSAEEMPEPKPVVWGTQVQKIQAVRRNSIILFDLSKISRTVL